MPPVPPALLLAMILAGVLTVYAPPVGHAVKVAAVKTKHAVVHVVTLGRK